ncbi:MAG: MraY family glycosyltransferase [Candidatus Dojkabacteria bacterium]
MSDMQNILTKLEEFFFLYDAYLFVAFLSALIAFFLTPLTGSISRRLQAVDLPPHLRKNGDQTKERRIHKEVMPNLGGLAVFAGFLLTIMIVFFTNTSAFQELQNIFETQDRISSQQFWHIVFGVSLVAIAGFWDAWKDMPAKSQFLWQFVAALVITLGGIRIDFIQILGMSVEFEIIRWDFTLLGLDLSFSLLSDLITILWIVGLINAMNWVSGIDGLGGMMSAFASITFLFIAVKFDVVVAAILAAGLAGAILGFLPFNLPPAKTFNGSAGDMVQGYLLAILAIISGAKLTASIILLAIPIIDAVWVLSGRIKNNPDLWKNPMRIMSISDKSHLHHRLLDLGFSVKGTLVTEMTIFLAFCVAAYYFAGFRGEAVLAIGMVLIAFAILALISIWRNRKLIKRNAEGNGQEQNQQPKTKSRIVREETPEEKYAY